MKRPEELSHMLTEMYNDTKDGKIHWNISVQTTENNEVSEKMRSKWRTVYPGRSMNVMFLITVNTRDRDFLMITYEMIKTAGDKVHTTNMIFLPPLESVCSSRQSSPYAVQASVCWQIRSTICGNYCLR